MHVLWLAAPLDCDWSEQLVRLRVPGIGPGAALTLRIDGRATPFQYTGATDGRGAEIVVRLGLSRGQGRRLEFTPGASDAIAPTDLRRLDLIVPDAGLEIGPAGMPIRVVRPRAHGRRVMGPFAMLAGRPVESEIEADAELLAFSLVQINVGPLYVEYELACRFVGGARYRLLLRCRTDEPMIEVHETLAAGLNARIRIALSPAGNLDRLLSHHGFDYEGDRQPDDGPLLPSRPSGLVLRVVAPPLGEYTVPTHRGWFALYSSAQEAAGNAAMLGVMTLEPGRWSYAQENAIDLHHADGRAELTASLAAGERHWALVAAPLEKRFAPGRRFLFHRLHAECNALRLDEHLDLAEDAIYDASCAQAPGVLGADYRERARAACAALPPLRRYLDGIDPRTLDDPAAMPLLCALEPTPERLDAMKALALQRLDRWVRQFQGWRDEQGDYAKNVIGFSRRLRGILIAYEMLRREGALSDSEIQRFNQAFVFAARRITDPGRWPHERTWLHPDHPQSTRDLYTYPGEHRPDRPVWTNCLPNFQSDPLMALAHLSAILPEHPDAPLWRRLALDDFDRQLNAYCGQSGAWEESINYAAYSLSYFVITFRVLKNRLGIDYFQDARMRRFVAWLVRFIAPVDKRWGVQTWPGVGNASLPTGGGAVLLVYADALAADDPLRDALIAGYQRLESAEQLFEHMPILVAAAAALPDPARGLYPLPPCASEHMDEVGVAFRHDHGRPGESFLFQKIGFAKDHYENDETAFNWYAKGTPLTMDYGTYTADVATAGAHNLVEIPDSDYLRRGYPADKLFSPRVDYTRCEVPVTLKLQHGRIRTFDQIDGPPREPLFFYMGDQNPVGPKIWVTRMLLFVKPDYLLLFDRVIGAAPHRFNLHCVGDSPQRDGPMLHVQGRFDLDLLCFVQHPERFELKTGELTPRFRTPEIAAAHRQSFMRIVNSQDGVYRTVLFAQERGRQVRITRAGRTGVRVETPEYEDFAFASDEPATEQGEAAAFEGRVGWIRRWKDGRVEACVPDGDMIAAFGVRIEGRGPWVFNADGRGAVEARGTPRPVRVSGWRGA